jgi:hypothetical protein
MARAAVAEPPVIQGIKTSNCNQIAAGINPTEGLSNPFNLHPDKKLIPPDSHIGQDKERVGIRHGRMG